MFPHDHCLHSGAAGLRALLASIEFRVIRKARLPPLWWKFDDNGSGTFDDVVFAVPPALTFARNPHKTPTNRRLESTSLFYMRLVFLRAFPGKSSLCSHIRVFTRKHAHTQTLQNSTTHTHTQSQLCRLDHVTRSSMASASFSLAAVSESNGRCVVVVVVFPSQIHGRVRDSRTPVRRVRFCLCRVLREDKSKKPREKKNQLHFPLMSSDHRVIRMGAGCGCELFVFVCWRVLPASPFKCELLAST